MTQDPKIYQQLEALENDPQLSDLLNRVYDQPATPKGMTDQIFSATVSQLKQTEPQTVVAPHRFPRILKYAACAAIIALGITAIILNQSDDTTTNTEAQIAQEIKDAFDSVDDFSGHSITADALPPAEPQQYAENNLSPSDMEEALIADLDALLASDSPSGL